MELGWKFINISRNGTNGTIWYQVVPLVLLVPHIRVDDTSAKVKAEDGNIIIEGDYNTAAIYNLSGATLPLDSTLAPGVYIVSVDGKPHKVLVK